MTEKHDMKWAIELAIASMENPDANWDKKYLLKAADMLRNGGPIIEKKQIGNFEECKKHKCPWPMCECDDRPVSQQKKYLIRREEREKIQIVPEKSDPTFEETK